MPKPGTPEWKTLIQRLRDNDPSLITLELAGSQIGASEAKDLSLALKDNCTLTTLDLGSNRIGDSGVKALSLALKDNCALTTLYLWGGQIGASGAKDLSLALKDNRTLTTLDLSSNQIGDSGAKDLSMVLKNNRTLTNLDLGFNQIRASGVKDLNLALKDNRSLTTLDLGGNQIGSSGAKDLSVVLKDNRILTTLDLGYSEIGDSGAKDLSMVLKDNRTLTTLDLSSNQIGDSGAKDLSMVLKNNRTLITLCLGKNQIGDTGAKDLSLALKDNRSLTILELNSNQIGDSGAKALSVALKDNHTLTNLDLGDNEIGNGLETEIEVFIVRNETLRDELHQAVQQGKLSIVQQKMAQGVSLASITDDDFNTPLHWAVLKGHIELTQWLIQNMQANGIPLTRLNIQRKTAQALATDPAIAALFTSFTNAINKPSIDTLAKPFATLEISFHIAAEQLTLGKKIGEGSFGIVFQGKYKYIQTDVAIKQLKASQLTPSALEEFQQEMKIMARLRHPNIVQLYGVTNSKPYCMVMEYLPKGDLYNLLHSKEGIELSWEQRAHIALDIAYGLAYLHKEKILHRDLKSKNILLDKNLTAKLADFGLSKVKADTSTSSTGKMVGTLQWMAPEIIQGEVYTLKADIYSYGMVVWELSSNKTPFEKANGNQFLIGTWVSQGKREDIPEGTPKKLAELMQRCWAQAVEKRPTSEVIIEELQNGSNKEEEFISFSKPIADPLSYTLTQPQGGNLNKQEEEIISMKQSDGYKSPQH